MKAFKCSGMIVRRCEFFSRARGVILVALAISAQAPSLAQSTNIAVQQVPFVGCKSDGQVGPLDAPNGKSPLAQIASSDAAKLAYYKAEDGFGVLGPRGWQCFSTYGSDGSTLYVSPTRIDGTELFSQTWEGFTGPAIQVSTMIGDTSGRFEVASMIARVFPAHLDFVENVISEKIRPASDFPHGPYPQDKLVYRSKEMVEYETPPNTEGLGTASRLHKNGDPINGVAILYGEETNLLHLSVRLPAELRGLAPAIISRVEREVKEAESAK